MRYSAVIDNSSLVYLSHLHTRKSFLHYLQSLFHVIYFPTEVVNEYVKGSDREPFRIQLIERLKPEQGFYRLCTSYDSLVFEMVKDYNGIDKGEAEAYAQFKKVQAQIIISDDRKFESAIGKLDSGIRLLNSMHILCWLELANFIPDWTFFINHLHTIRPFNSKDLKRCYMQVASQRGIKVSSKKVSEKCNLKRILNN